MNNYQIGLVGYFCVILVFGFLFLSKQERAVTEGRTQKAGRGKHAGLGGRSLGRSQKSQGGLQRSQSLCGSKRHSEDLRLQIMSP